MYLRFITFYFQDLQIVEHFSIKKQKIEPFSYLNLNRKLETANFSNWASKLLLIHLNTLLYKQNFWQTFNIRLFITIEILPCDKYIICSF